MSKTIASEKGAVGDVSGNMTAEDVFASFSVDGLESNKGQREPIRQDIDVTSHPYNIPVINPNDYGIVIISDKGKASIDKKAFVRYLRICKIVYCGSMPYMFDGCIYTQIDDESVARMIYQASERIGSCPFMSKSSVSDIIAMLRTTSQDIDIEPPKNWDGGAYEGTIIPFQNGLYNVDTDTLLPFTPWLFITHQLDALYIPSVQDHDVERIYRNIIPDKNTLKFFFQMVGYSLFSEKLSPPAIFLIYGPGNTGKSALQMAVQAAAGYRNVSTLDLAQISGNFTTAELQGHLINICGETGSGMSREISKVDGELLKKLSDGQAVTVQRKYGHPYQMVNTTKLWFITNSLPDFGDTTSGLYRRLFIIPCRTEQSWDEQIYDKLTEPMAVSWLMNRAVEGYRDFLDDGCRFKISAEMQYELRTYKVQDGVMDFLEFHFGTSDKYVIPDKLNGMFISDIYDEYKIYTVNGGGRPLSRRKMAEKIRNEYCLKSETVRTVQNEGKVTNRVKFVKNKTND